MADLIIALLIIVPLFAFAATWKFLGWARRLSSRFLWGVFWVSLASDLAALPISFLAGRRLVLGPDAPAMPNASTIAALAIIVLEAAFIVLWWRWRDLDKER